MRANLSLADAFPAVWVERFRRGAGASARAVTSLGSETVVFASAVAIVNISNYVFHIATSRVLGPSDYGALAALLGVVLVASVPLGVLQTVAAKNAAALRSEGRDAELAPLAASMLKTLLPMAWLGALLFAAVIAPTLALFLHVDYAAASLLAVWVFAATMGSVPLGILQGQQRFTAIAALLVLGGGLRLAGGVAFVVMGLGVFGAVLATVVASLVTVPLAVMCARVSGTLWASAHSSFSHLRGSFLASLLGLSAFWLFAEADLALVRHFLDTENAGFYSAAGLMSRVLLFVGIATAFVAFPRFVLKRRQPADALRTLHLALAIAAAVILAMTIVIAVFRTTLIALAFGDAFGPAAALLPSLCVAMGLLALAAILTYFHIAMESRVHLAMLTGFIVVAALVATFHSEPQEVALIIASVAAAVAAVQYRAAIDLCRARDQLMAETGVRLEPASGGQTELSLVLPCRNTAQSLPNVIHSLLHELQEFESYEILIVSDGSTDDTVAVGERFSSDCVRTLQTERGNGKGSALRLGLTQARGNYVAFLDGDGDVGPEAIRPFLALMKLYEPDIVIGSKRHPLSEVYYPPLRRLASWGYHLLARVLFRINIRDTQTGVKLIRREVLSSVLPRTLERGYAFDLEFLVIARSLGFKRMFEAPIRLDYKFESQIDLGAAARIGWDTLKVFYRHYLLDLYRRTPPLRTPLSSPLVVSQTRARPMGNTSTRGLEILVVNWRDTHDPAAGGAETFVHQVARRWATHGHNVTLITSRPSGAPRTELIDGIRVKRLGRLADGSFHALVQREFMRIRGVDLVIEAVNTIPFLTPLWRSRLPRTVPLIFQRADDIWDAHYGPIVAAIGKRVERRLLRMYHDAPVLTISESARLDLARSGLSNVTVVEPGIDHPASVGHQKDIAPTFLFVGRLAANKRPDHAVEAFAEIHRELPTSRLWIVGRGPLEAKLRKATPSGVEILGFLPRDELHARMGRAHCLLVPSVREGWGLVVVEANAVRTPAVGYDVPGLRDSIRNGKTGKLVTPGDPRAMAAAALELIGDPESYSQICDAAHTWSERFSWDITAERVLAFAMRTTSDTALDAVRVPSFEGVAR